MSCFAVFLPFFRIRGFGQNKIPDEGGVLMVANHQSYLDPVLIGVCTRRALHPMARDTLFKNHFFAWLIRSIGAFAVRRGQFDMGAVREAIKRLRDGHVVLVFPEGTRTRDGSIAEFRPGITLISRRANAPILPVVIDGAYEAWPRHQAYPKPNQIFVMFGDLISVDQQKEIGERAFAVYLRDRLVDLQDEAKRIRAGGKQEKMRK